jgi:hypothetical protein
MFTFNDEYTLKSIISLVCDENDRIVSLGLATHDDLRKLYVPVLRKAIEKTSDNVRDKSAITNALALLHNDLKSVSLPGDFEKIAELLGSSPFDVSEDEGEEEMKEEMEEKLDEYLQDEEEDDMTEDLLSTLGNIAYDLGKSGDHEAAYLIERKIRKMKTNGE